MKKKIFAVSLLIIVLISCFALPAAAVSYDDGSFPSSTYYAAIPFDTVFFDAGSVFSAGSNMTQFTIGQPVGSGQDSSSLVVSADLIGYDFVSGNDPVPDLFDFTFTQSRYSNSSSYYSAYNRYQTSGVGSVVFTSGTFGMDYLQYSALSNYGGLVVPAGTQLQVTCSVSFYALNSQSNSWELQSNSYSRSYSSSSSGLFKIFPSVGDLFGSNYALFPGRMIPVESFVLSVSFANSVSDFSLAMMYGNKISFASVMASSVDYLAQQKSTVEYRTEYVSIFDQGGDLFGWLVHAVDGLFTAPILGDLSLGDLLGFSVGIGVFLIVLHLLR